MKKFFKIAGLIFVVLIALALIVSNIGQIFFDRNNRSNLPVIDNASIQKQNYEKITSMVTQYNRDLPLAVGGGLSLVQVKFDTDVNCLIFSIEGSDSISYEEVRRMFPKIKSCTIHELQNLKEKQSDPLMESLIDAGSSIKYMIVADTLNVEIKISPNDLKQISTFGRDSLAINYLEEYASKINAHMPDIDDNGEGLLKVKYDAKNNKLVWYCLTTCNKSQAGDAYNKTFYGLRKSYTDRTDAIVDAIVESDGKTEFIYQNFKGETVFSFVITGKEISNTRDAGAEK